MVEKTKLILLATDCDTTRILYHYLKNHFTIEKVVFENKINKKEFIKRRIKKLGFITVTGQILFQTIVNKFLVARSKKRIRQILEADQLNLSPIVGSSVINISSVNDSAIPQLLNEFEANIVLVNGTRILSKKLLTSVKKIFINTHLGITPAYRGVHGGYWALAKNDKENFGATVHLVDAGIDTGGVLSYVKAKPSKEDNFATYPYIQISAALPVIKEVIADISGKVQDVKHFHQQKSNLYYHPTIWQYLYNRIFKAVK